MKSRAWIWVILVLAFLGLADSSYLAQSALSNTPLICNVQSMSGCNIVAESPYSRLFGIPLALYGVAFYGILFVLSALELVLVDRVLRRILQGLAALGFLASVYFVNVQIFLIGAFCIYCFISALLSLSIFGSATAIEPLRKDGGTPGRRTWERLLPRSSPKVPFAPQNGRERPQSGGGSGPLSMPPRA